MIDRICISCKKPFKARAADVARGWAKCCSKSCAAIRRERVNIPSPKQLKQRRIYAERQNRDDDFHTAGLNAMEEGWDGHKIWRE